MRSVPALPFVAALLAATSCGPPPRPAQSPPPASQPQSQPALGSALGVDDLFDVRVYGESDLSNVYRVGADGNIEFPLIGKVRAAGRTTRQLAAEIQRRLGERYLQNPQVTIFVKEYRSRRFSVYGQVQRPGTFPFEENLSIVEAIARAGGFTPMAAENRVRLTRRQGGRDVTIEVPMVDIREGRAAGLLIKPGDKIFIPERFF